MPPLKAINGASPGTGIPGGSRTGNQLTQNTGMIPAGQARKVSTQKPQPVRNQWQQVSPNAPAAPVVGKAQTGAFRTGSKWYWQNENGKVAEVPWSVATPEWQKKVRIIATPGSFKAPTATPPAAGAPGAPGSSETPVNSGVNTWPAGAFENAMGVLTQAMQDSAPLRARWDAIRKGWDNKTSVFHTNQELNAKNAREGSWGAGVQREQSGMGDWGTMGSGAFVDDNKRISNELEKANRENDSEWGLGAQESLKTQMVPVLYNALLGFLEAHRGGVDAAKPQIDEIQALLAQLTEKK